MHYVQCALKYSCQLSPSHPPYCLSEAAAHVRLVALFYFNLVFMRMNQQCKVTLASVVEVRQSDKQLPAALLTLDVAKLSL